MSLLIHAPARRRWALLLGGSAALSIMGLTTALPAFGASPAPTPAACGANPVANWSLTQRLNQVLMVGGQFSDLSASAPEASAGVGAFVFFGQPASGSGPSIKSGIASLNADASAAGQVAPWMSTDEEGGTVARLAQVIGALPTARQMAAQWSPAQVQQVLANHGSSMLSLGVNMDLAPVVDTASPTDTVADEKDRSFSENPQVASAYGLAFANGLRSAGVVPVLKHFPGLGHASADTDLGASTDPTLTQLEASDLIPFEQGIDVGEPVIMVGHPIVPGLSGGLPASLSPATYTFLRSSLHFPGVALTDSLAAGAISAAGYSEASAAVKAMEAGADMVMVDAAAWQSSLSQLQQAVNSGALSQARVNASVSRILASKGLQICPSTWTSLGGVLERGPAATASTSTQLDVFAIGTDLALWHRQWNGTAWSNWESLGGRLTSSPAAVASQGDRIDVFARGTDNAVWHRAFDGSAWSSWDSLGGALVAAPAAAWASAGELDVFAVGTDRALYQRTFNGTAWSGWQLLGGRLTSGLGAVSWGPNRIDVFGRATDNALWHRAFDGTSWSNWESLGGVLASGPAVASWGVNRLDLFVVGTDSTLFHKFWNGAAWSAWTRDDNQFWSADPAAVSPAIGVIELFERGANGALYISETNGS
jgi:beta-glucosidase-like glycosyl hydrolase